MSSGDQFGRAAKAAEAGYLSTQYPDTMVPNESTPATSMTDLQRPSKSLEPKDSITNFYAEDPNDPNSHWIHRDKLARIENEELQAAGFILPKVRSSSKVRHRDRSVESVSLSRKQSKVSEIKVSDVSVPNWDLRLPEEVANDYFVSAGTKGGSKIPVAKTSPLPLRDGHIDREAPIHKKQDGTLDGTSIKYPKPRSRSASTSMKFDITPPSKSTGSAAGIAAGSGPAKRGTGQGGSPKKPPVGIRKPSNNKTTQGRAKARSSPRKGSGSSGGKPTTRSGDGSSGPGSKPMEGEPPWMVSAYTPDPRLPPDQQLLPTVARRLQQEQWEKEGKFGNIYDKQFRPLNEEGFGNRISIIAGPSAVSETEKDADWPLKDTEKVPSSPTKSKSYSTMPKIQDKPLASPLPSPRSPIIQPAHRISTQQVVRVPDVPNEEEQKKGCGCCIIM